LINRTNFLHLLFDKTAQKVIRYNNKNDKSMAWIPPTYPLKLAKEHAHPRDTRIQFDEPTHVYTIDGDSSSYQSVTTLIHAYVQPFDADAIIAKMQASPKWFASPYYGMTAEEIKKKWSDSGKDASEAGTKTHLHIEYWYNDVTLPEPDNSKEFQYFLKYQEEVGKQYIPWATEKEVFYEEAHIAGQIDMLYLNPETGNLIIADWKRVKEIKTENRFQNMRGILSHLPDTNYWHYALQLSIYKHILEKKYGYRVEKLFLVVLHPDASSYNVVDLPILADEVEAVFRERIAQVNAGTAVGSLKTHS